ncbi:Alpha-1,3/1,6-mannosyltransferase ALG2 [Histomonas meleagridis]|uniref:Alpha-1-3/1-6-mannosyltransferase ALG2 n=1 Tax=Histomonas meleagridis TaxID=135588 RepID=UPI00355A4D55|nr:Alpha-1,3/1,6-mannosyltransferase ALG2 [Histomonas meleagridis]KAH0802154.1 Alpha-1-3/1-6-mannosyltransferase ALG2 [Histomonas meleagridis]
MPKIAIIHPDLGIGGAERLILDVAHAVKAGNLETSIWTSRYEKDRAFKDAADFDIHIHGNYIPRHIFGCFHIIFALLRNLWLTIRCAMLSNAEIFIVDQISAWVPILRLLKPKAKVIFYCHFPDLLLAPHDSTLRKLYRLPFDFIEKFGIKRANLILVNSNFTAGKTKQVLGIENVEVLYPCVDCSHKVERNRPEKPVFISLNRYERKKNHGLAIQALAIVNKTNPDAKLIIAGGYDPMVSENVEHEEELKAIARYNGIENNVTFLRNITDEEKWRLIGNATAVIYTPTNEHFGIVPIEAMSVGVPVIGCNSGGPLETINTDGCKLCDSDPNEFAKAMVKVINDSDHCESLKKHAQLFGFESFQKQWEDQIKKLI